MDNSEIIVSSAEIGSDDLSLFVGVMVAVVIISLIYLIASLIVSWKLYVKAGQAGWSVLVPIYNMYIYGVIAKQDTWLIATLIVLGIVNNFIPFLGIFFFLLAIYFFIYFIQQYKASVMFWVTYIFFPFIAVFLVKNVVYVGDDAAQDSAPEAPGLNDLAPEPIPPQSNQPEIGFTAKPLDEQQFTSSQPAPSSTPNTQLPPDEAIEVSGPAKPQGIESSDEDDAHGPTKE